MLPVGLAGCSHAVPAYNLQRSELNGLAEIQLD